MKFVVDTNIILSALIRNRLTREIICSENLQFYTLDYVLLEMKKHMDLIVRKSGIAKEEVEMLLAFFMEKILIVLMV